MATTGTIDPATELQQLRTRLAEAEETLRAVRAGEVDAVVVEGPDGPQVYTLKTAADPYRLLVEQMAQAALTVSPDGLILFCNGCLAQLLDVPRERLIGTRLQEHAAPGTAGRLDDLLASPREPGREIALRTRDGRAVELYVSSATVEAGGEAVRCLVVTDLSQHELRLRHAAVVEASRDIIYTLDDRLVIQTWNHGAEALTGLSAAQAVGRSRRGIAVRHVLPNISGVLIVQATIQFAVAILAEAALGYLGLGVRPPQPSWGRMLLEAQRFMHLDPAQAIVPGLAIALAVLGLNLLGDGLRDLLDPRLRRAVR